MDYFVTTEQAAEYLGVAVRTVRGWVQKGILKSATRIDQTHYRTYIRQSDLEKFKKEREEKKK